MTPTRPAAELLAALNEGAPLGPHPALRSAVNLFLDARSTDEIAQAITQELRASVTPRLDAIAGDPKVTPPDLLLRYGPAEEDLIRAAFFVARIRVGRLIPSTRAISAWLSPASRRRLP